MLFISEEILVTSLAYSIQSGANVILVSASHHLCEIIWFQSTNLTSNLLFKKKIIQEYLITHS
jgi:hypothetical protein